MEGRVGCGFVLEYLKVKVFFLGNRAWRRGMCCGFSVLGIVFLIYLVGTSRRFISALRSRMILWFLKR